MGHPQRLSGHDYSSPGYYFVTIKTHRAQKLLGTISDDSIRLTEFGEIVNKEWLRTATLRSDVLVDEFVIMPDHFHAILVIKESTGATKNQGNNRPSPEPTKQILACPPGSLGAIIRGFKGACTYQINKLRNQRGQRVWQQSYFDHVIKNSKVLERIRYYIRNNPERLIRPRKSTTQGRALARPTSAVNSGEADQEANAQSTSTVWAR